MKYKFTLTPKNYESILKISLCLINKESYSNKQLYLSIFLLYLAINMGLYSFRLYKAMFIFCIIGLLFMFIFSIVTSHKFLIKNVKYISRYYIKKDSSIFNSQTIEICNDTIIHSFDEYSVSTRLCDIKNIIYDDDLILIIGPNNRICGYINQSAFTDSRDKMEFLKKIQRI